MDRRRLSQVTGSGDRRPVGRLGGVWMIGWGGGRWGGAPVSVMDGHSCKYRSWQELQSKRCQSRNDDVRPLIQFLLRKR